MAALRRYSLVRVDADGIFVHRLLQTVVCGGLDAEAERAWAIVAVRLLQDSFPRPSEVVDWPECERLLPHAMEAAGYGQLLEVEPERWLWLLAQAATYLLHRGQYRQALFLNEQALAGLRRVLGEDHPDTLAFMKNLAAVRRELGEL